MVCICSEDGCEVNARFVINAVGKYCIKHKKEGSKKIKYILCIDKKCTSIAKFSYEDNKKEFCKTHSKPDMKNNTSYKCKEKDCNNDAYYNYEGIKESIYCNEHKKVDMINNRYKYCKTKDCNDRAYYSIDGKTLSYCKTHKTDDMILAGVKRCKDCTLVANFGFAEKKKEYCSTHKKPDMICVTSKKCENIDCDKNATYCLSGDTLKFCKKHKIDGMTKKYKSFCKFIGCINSPSYNFSGLKPKFCENHIDSGMINVHSKKCLETDCKTQPTFGLVEKIATHCFKHKNDDMFDVYHKICEKKDCKKRCCFGFIGKENQFCGKHKETGMVNLQDLSWKCSEDKCTTDSRYGKPGSKRTKCFVHREVGMIKRPNGKCLDCRMNAIYGKNYIPFHCEIHKLDDEVNLVEKKCSSCGLIMILDKDNKCEYCNPEMFKTTRLAKQNALMSYLDSIKLNGISTDKTIDGGMCGLERPDRIYECNDYIIILECDENQDRERNCTCEQTRMVNIAQSFGGMPVYFIRFNPDDYLPDNDKLKPEDIKKRYKLLGDLINSMIKHKIELPKSFVSSLYLYFDGWKSFKTEKWQILLEFEKTIN